MIPKDYVHACYSVETYNIVYKHVAMLMNGEELWSKTRYITSLPPAFEKKKGGRSATKRRISEDEEVKKKSGVQRLPKQNYKVVCQFCKEEGHNKSGCQMRKLVEEFMLYGEETRNEAARGGGTAGYDTGAAIADIDEIKDLEVEEMTQPSNYPHCTQEDDIDIEPPCNKKPTTRQGIQKLNSIKKARIDDKDGQDYVTGDIAATIYSISSLANPPQPVKLGVQIRAPPMAFHPHNFIGSKLSNEDVHGMR